MSKKSVYRKTKTVGILKGLRPFSGVQRQSLWWGDSPQCGEMSAKLTEGTGRLGWGKAPHIAAKRPAREGVPLIDIGFLTD